MKIRNNSIVAKIFLTVGAFLLVAGIALLAYWQWNIHSSAQKTAACIQTINALIPAPQGALLEERTDSAMATLQIEGTDYIGILEIPRFDSALPICADWGRITKYPCRFEGSLYDRSLKIGATTQTGQYDFYRELSVGDTVLFTDMEGNRYTYTVKTLRYEKHADQEALNEEDCGLTLFVKNIYAFEYLIISCN